MPDRYVWDLEPNGEFTVASARRLVDSSLLGISSCATRWNGLVPKKVNVLLWRIERDRIPSLLNLSDKGIELNSLLCHVCSLTGESTAHLFCSCPLISPIWGRIAAWWNVNLPPVLSVRNLLQWGESVPLTVVKRRRFEAMVAVAFWI